MTRAQLIAAGVSKDTVKRWLRDGRLHREFPGVYRVGHRGLSIEARYLAAVLACGPRAVLSGAAGAHRLRLIRGPPPPPEVSFLEGVHPTVLSRLELLFVDALRAAGFPSRRPTAASAPTTWIAAGRTTA